MFPISQVVYAYTVVHKNVQVIYYGSGTDAISLLILLLFLLLLLLLLLLLGRCL